MQIFRESSFFAYAFFLPSAAIRINSSSRPASSAEALVGSLFNDPTLESNSGELTFQTAMSAEESRLY